MKRISHPTDRIGLINGSISNEEKKFEIFKEEKHLGN